MDSELQQRFEGLTVDERLVLFEPLYPQAVSLKKGGRQLCAKTEKGRKEYRHRTEFVWEVYDRKCVLCGSGVSLEQVTLDHRAGRGMGGSNRDERINKVLPAHAVCNARKGSCRIAEGEICSCCGHDIVIVSLPCFRCGEEWC